jgi:hypothetical protein
MVPQKIWVGPSVVAKLASALRDVGVEGVEEGTEVVLFRASKEDLRRIREELIRKYGTSYGFDEEEVRGCSR